MLRRSEILSSADIETENERCQHHCRTTTPATIKKDAKGKSLQCLCLRDGDPGLFPLSRSPGVLRLSSCPARLPRAQRSPLSEKRDHSLDVSAHHRYQGALSDFSQTFTFSPDCGSTSLLLHDTLTSPLRSKTSHSYLVRVPQRSVHFLRSAFSKLVPQLAKATASPAPASRLRARPSWPWRSGVEGESSESHPFTPLLSSPHQ
jgi:hypothetical protein